MPNAYRIGRVNVGNTAANTPFQLISATENSTGAVIRTGHIWVVGGTMFLVAEKTMPANANAATRTIFSVSSSSGVRLSQSLPYPLYIDPGFGVYMFATSTVTEGYGLISYDLVDGFENA